MKAQVMKKLVSDGKELQIGDIVDVSGWRNAKALESNRYIRFVTEEELPKKETKSKVSQDKDAE